MHSTTPIDKALKALNIHKYGDYRQFFTLWEYGVNTPRTKTSDDVRMLRDSVKKYFDTYRNENIKGQYISINPDSFPDNQISNYMCMFPKRSLIETSTLLSYLDSTPFDCAEYDLPPDDFVKQYFRFRDLLTHDIARLYPISKKEEYAEGAYSATDSEMIKPLNNVAIVNPGKNFTGVIEDPNYVFLALPWLYNANSDTFIEIADKYPLEFEQFTIAIEKIACAGNGLTNLQDKVTLDLKEALANIQIACEKEQKKLRALSVVAVVGTALTVFPIAKPDIIKQFINIDNYKAIIGGTSLAANLKLVSDFVSLKNQGIGNPYWVIWKWQQKTII